MEQEIVEEYVLRTDEELEAHRKKHWEHYHRLFKETKHCLYYINSRGYVEKYFKKDYTDVGTKAEFFHKVPSRLYKRNKKSKYEEYLAVVIDHQRYAVKTLVAKTFSRLWVPGSHIYHKNKKIKECNFKNLIISPPGSKQKQTHRGKEILVLINKRWVKFSSFREASIELNVSISSFRRHVKGKIKNKSKSSIPTFRFKYVE